jgi:hypothetical protein
MKNASQLPDPILTAEKLLAKAGIDAPPVNLNQITSIWPNLFVVEEELDGTGYLLPVGELGAEILIKKDDSEERKRFTIAHELGHWVLGLTLKRKIGHFAQPKNVLHAEVERWCDTFASNILMPSSMIRASVPQTDPVLAIVSIAQAASRFKVSEEAFYIRLWETLKFQVALVTLKNQSGERICALHRSFAGRREELALERFLSKSAVIAQLEGSPFPILSVSSEKGRITCAGRRLDVDRLMLVLKWPEIERDAD